MRTGRQCTGAQQQLKLLQELVRLLFLSMHARLKTMSERPFYLYMNCLSPAE